MAMARARRVAGLGSAVTDFIQTLPFSYAAAFPHIDFASLPPTTTIGDLLDSGAITTAEYEDVFGTIPTVESTAADYTQFVNNIRSGIATGTYTSDSLDGVTPEWYLNHYTVLATNATARSGGFQVSSTGDVQEIDQGGNVVGTVPQAPPPNAGTIPPARYLVNGVEFLSTGDVVTVNGIAVTGKTLTTAQVARLVAGGTLSPTELTAIAPPPPATSNTLLPPSSSGGVQLAGFALPDIPPLAWAGLAALAAFTLFKPRR
jgi:hypothetical protein